MSTAGEAPPSFGSNPAPGSNTPATPTSRGDAQSPQGATPQTHPPRSSPKETTSTGARRPSAAPKYDSRGGGGRGVACKEKAAVGADGGSTGSRPSTSPGLRKEGGGGKLKTERRDGVVEKAISDAEDVVVCVLHPGGEAKGGFRQADR